MKSIVTCKYKTTAKELGAEEGDKFVVLSVKDSFGGLYQPPLPEGTVVVLIEDDDTSLPCFKIVGRKGRLSKIYLCFTYLARYEEPKEVKIVLDKVKFDMKAIAADLGLSLEEAHNVVQQMLFDQGYEWQDGTKSVYYPPHYNSGIQWLYLDEGLIACSPECDEEPLYTKYRVKIEKSFCEVKEPEIITVNGKQYKLID